VDEDTAKEAERDDGPEDVGIKSDQNQRSDRVGTPKRIAISSAVSSI